MEFTSHLILKKKYFVKVIPRLENVKKKSKLFLKLGFIIIIII